MAEPGTVILKIHGDLNHPGRLIITEEDYDTFLERYPLLSTYISNLLISKTPLFIGYSLEDPNFRHLWQVVGNRLGKLRRSAYVILVNPSRVDTARYDRRGVKVIALPGSKIDYRTALSLLFQEIKEYWQEEVIKNSIVMSDETLLELTLPRDSQTRLCYFAIPARLHTYYKTYVFHIVERFGFTPVTAMDILSPGDNILAKISTLIERSTVIVADISTSGVMSYLKLADDKERRILIVAEKGSEISLDISGLAYIQRPVFPEPPDQKFISSLEKFFGDFSKESEEKLYNEPMRLLKKKEYRAAVISSFTLFEEELKEKILTELFSDEEKVPRHFELVAPIGVARHHQLITPDEFNQLTDWFGIRTRLVHTKEKISKKEAYEIVNGIMSILQNIENKNDIGSR